MSTTLSIWTDGSNHQGNQSMVIVTCDDQSDPNWDKQMWLVNVYAPCSKRYTTAESLWLMDRTNFLLGYPVFFFLFFGETST